MKVKYIIWIALAVVLGVFLSCEEEEPKTGPRVETASVNSIMNTSAAVGGCVLDDSGSDVTERGVYWGTTTNPENSGNKMQIGEGVGTFFDTLRSLTAGVKYFVKAYATNSKGTSYGAETFFTTQINFPTVSTADVTELTPNSAKVGGNVSDNGGFDVTERGVFWGPYPNPKLTGIKLTLGSGVGQFSQTLTGLERTNTYYVVAFATNIKGTSYGNELNFTTVPSLPVVSTYIARDVKTTSAEVGGEVTSNGGSTVTERGVFWGTSANPETTGSKLAVGIGTGEFLSTLENLNPNATYYLKAFATNSIGTAYGAEVSFKTLGKSPEAITLKPTSITSTTAVLNAIVSANDLNSTITFEYGVTTGYGQVVAIAENPIIQNDDTVSVTIDGLQSETTYHFRVKAENSLGVAFGADSTFTTVVTGITGTVSDIEGNTYSTIGIGHQYWMTENLRVTKYNDGTKVALLNADTIWVKGNPGYCWYDNDSLEHSQTYGAIYNWFAVNSGKLCPAGWRVPTNDEFTELVNYLGDASVAGGFLKESGFSHWKSPNNGASDGFNFSALPGGKRSDQAVFDFMTIEGNWWTSSEYSSLTASYFYLLYNYSNSFQAYINKKNGMYVRCIKD